MLLLQRELTPQHKHSIFTLFVCACVCMGHVFGGLLLLCNKEGAQQRITISLKDYQPLAVHFVPFTAAPSPSKIPVQTGVRSSQKTQPQTQPSTAAPAVQTKMAEKPAIVQKKQSAKKSPIKKSPPTPAEKKISNKKNTPVVPAKPQQSSVKKKPAVQDPASIHKPPPVPVTPQQIDQESNHPMQPVVQECSYDQYGVTALIQRVHDDILEQWKRPVVTAQQECHIQVLIDRQGNKKIQIVQSSRALALDLSVRNFVQEYVFPDQLWNKELVLIF